MREGSTYSNSPNCFFMENKAYLNGGAILSN
jgi:predicted outer membrane repeat protein